MFDEIRRKDEERPWRVGWVALAALIIYIVPGIVFARALFGGIDVIVLPFFVVVGSAISLVLFPYALFAYPWYLFGYMILWYVWRESKIHGKKIDLYHYTEKKLLALGYDRIHRNKWVNGKRIVQVVHSSEYGRDYIRIWWKEDWRTYRAIVFDYSRAGGPICVVPVTEFFSSDFVNEKSEQDSYANREYWSCNFPIDHKLAKRVLSFKDRWNVL